VSRSPAVAAGALVAVLAVAGGPVAMPAAASAAQPAGACLNPVQPRDVRPHRPWEVALLDPARVWPVTRGADVRVGVIDSGVDADNPQLRGKVFPGWDFVRNQAGARFDCAPHGTAVASVIAGAPMDGTGFHGMAPDARIVPARVTDTEEIKGGPAAVAAAIRYVVDHGVRVINLSLTVFQDVPEIRQAVEYARQRDVLVIAAAGNRRGEGNPRPYPAAYPGVIGVGSIDATGARAPDSQAGDYVDLVAPGVNVTGCVPGAGQDLWQGTSFATPFVAGAAALVRSALPALSADQVAERLITTAGVARGGTGSVEYGAGVVNPYRAVTDIAVHAGVEPVTPAPVPAPRPDPVAQRRAAETSAAVRTARTTAMTVLGATLGGLAVAGMVLAGHRRGWAVRRRKP
jgi:membrane-anchored mycosin MYCP